MQNLSRDARRKRRRGSLVYLQHKVKRSNGLQPSGSSAGVDKPVPVTIFTQAGLEVRRRQLEARKLEAWRHRAADERPGAEALRLLPRLRRHHGLRPLAGCAGRCRAAATRRFRPRRWRAAAARRRTSARPRRHRPCASAKSRRPAAGSRWRSRPRGPMPGRRDRGTSRGSARLRDAARGPSKADDVVGLQACRAHPSPRVRSESVSGPAAHPAVLRAVH